MKTKLIILSALAIAVSCAPKGREIDFSIEPGNVLFLPVEASFSDLSKGKPVQFEWAPSVARDNGYVSYEVLFDKVGGDFSAPVGRVAGQFGGSRSFVSIPAKTLSKIARKAGVGVYSEGSLKWTVRASKGLGGEIYSMSRTIKVRTMNAMDPLPEGVTLYGAATEDAEQGIPMVASRGIDKVPAEAGQFECFTRIGDGVFQIKDEAGRFYQLNSDGSISYSETVADSKLPFGIVWLKMDFDGMVWSSKNVETIEYYAASWSENRMTTDRKAMSYAGKGVWQLLNYPNTISLNEAGDTRHRFDATFSDGTVVYMGTEASLGTAYTKEYLTVDFYTDETIGSRDWDKTWNFMLSDAGRTMDCYLRLNGDNPAGTWYHEYIFK